MPAREVKYAGSISRWLDEGPWQKRRLKSGRTQRTGGETQGDLENRHRDRGNVFYVSPRFEDSNLK
jgi:hypothetical protein